jgi:aryl-alcohol dehydrogenase-like predicted oxidoreductase
VIRNVVCLNCRNVSTRNLFEGMVFKRTLGRSGIQVSAIGLGCWAIGGPFTNEHGQPVGWGTVQDGESVRAVHRALDLGVTFFDTANVYGTGHSEQILGLALAGYRDKVVIATKFGRAFKENSRRVDGNQADPAFIRQSCADSLRRLQTDYIDLYQFHLGNYDLDRAGDVRQTLEDLVAEGKIRAYGWSTDDPERARLFAEGPHCAAIQFQMNMFERNDAMVALCEEHNLAALIRGPLGKGLLTGKFDADSRLPDNDVRRDWDFQNGEQACHIQRLDGLREVLTEDGRTLAQAALGWLWSRSEKMIPIPGFKSVAQVEDNVGATQFGPLPTLWMDAIDAQLAG